MNSHNLFYVALEMVAAFVVLVRTIYIASRVGPLTWTGHPWRLFGISVAYPLLCGGAIGIVLHYNFGHDLLLFGVMALLLSDRR